MLPKLKTLLKALPYSLAFAFHFKRPAQRVIQALLFSGAASLALTHPAEAFASPSVFKAGFAKTKITPEVPDTWIDLNKNGTYEPNKGEKYQDKNGNGKFDAVWLGGFQNGRPASGIHDDLWARTMLLDSSGTRIALVAIDAIGMMAEDVNDVVDSLPATWNLQKVLISSSHTHAAPDLQGLWGPTFIVSGVNKNYVAFVKQQIRESIRLALEASVPARLNLANVPDFYKGLLQDTRPPIVYDNNIAIMNFEDLSTGKTLGTLVNWNNHPEVFFRPNSLVTSDYVHFLREGIESGISYNNQVVAEGLGGVALFVNGAVGGLLTTGYQFPVHDLFTGQTYLEPSKEKAQSVGFQVAKAALDELASTRVVSNATPELKWVTKKIQIPVTNNLLRLGGVLGILNRRFNGFFEVAAEVTALRIGDAMVVTMPGEAYPELLRGGIESPEGADFPGAPVEVPPLHTLMPTQFQFTFGLTNDAMGYFIPKTEWDTRAPHLYGSPNKPYGEEASAGPDAAGRVHSGLKSALKELEATNPR